MIAYERIKKKKEKNFLLHKKMVIDGKNQTVHYISGTFSFHLLHEVPDDSP